MNNISKKLLAYSLLGVALTGCNNKQQDQEKEKSHQTFKEVLTKDDIDQKTLEKISEFFNNTENSYETFIQIVNMSEEKLSIMHKKIDDQKVKKFINFVTMIKLTILFSEASTINEEIEKETKNEEINENIEIATESSNKVILEEYEENITSETINNEEIEEFTEIKSEDEETIEETEITESNTNDGYELLTDSDNDDDDNDDSNSNNNDNEEF